MNKSLTNLPLEVLLKISNNLHGENYFSFLYETT